MIDCKNIHHSYDGKKEILKDVSFSIPRATIEGVLGPNGSGKTTLFQILNTSIVPTSGTLHFDGEELTAKNIRDLRKKIGVVFQSPSLDKKLTVYENLNFQGALYGLPKKQLKIAVDEALEKFKLVEYQHTLVEKLSGGWARRTEIAKSVLHKPKILFLDEPSTGLDPVVRIELWNILRELQSQGCTIMFTTHLLEEADLCDHLMVMHEGRKVASDTPSNLKDILKTYVMFVKVKSDEAFKKVVDAHSNVKYSSYMGQFRLEVPNNPDFVQSFVSQHGANIKEMSYRTPNLEDVFVHFTGANFHQGGAR